MDNFTAVAMKVIKKTFFQSEVKLPYPEADLRPSTTSKVARALHGNI